ncbi:MAG: hypothetical protein AAF628_35385 [Planctomycetota bacterium]
MHLQILLAKGGSLDEALRGRDLTPRGHALEARIYAESPETGYLPQAGRLQRVVEPEGPGIRVDSGVHAGIDVTPHYDPMLAKLIVHAPDREAACRRMARALEETVYLGIDTNVDFLHRVVEDLDFRAGALRTDFLDLKPGLAQPEAQAPPFEAYVAAAMSQMLGGGRRAVAGVSGAGPRAASPWNTLGHLRLWEARA